MLDKILSGIKDEALGAINDNPDIPNNKLDDILDIVGKATEKEVSKESKSSGLENLMNLFSDKKNNSKADTIQNNIKDKVVKELMGNSNLKEAAAKEAVKAILPMVLSKITKKNNETADDDASPLGEIFGSLLGGDKGGGFLKNLLK